MNLIKGNSVDVGNQPTRIQIACYGVLVAECIVPQRDADRTWSAYSVAKYKKYKPIGGCIISSASSRRIWNVAVGETITKEGE